MKDSHIKIQEKLKLKGTGIEDIVNVWLSMIKVMVRIEHVVVVATIVTNTATIAITLAMQD